MWVEERRHVAGAERQPDEPAWGWWHRLSTAAHAVSNAATWTWQHRGLVAGAAAAGVCFASGLLACGIAAVIAYSARTSQRGWRHYRENAADLITSAFSFGVGAAAGEAANGLGVGFWGGKVLTSGARINAPAIGYQTWKEFGWQR